MIMVKKCVHCDDWEPGVEQIAAAQMLSDMHHGAPYTAKYFMFCPWCGELLVKVPE